VDVSAADIEDRLGGFTEKLRGLAEADANPEFLLARRASEQPREAVVFAAPIKGAKQAKAARALGFHKSSSLHGIRVMATKAAVLGGAGREEGLLFPGLRSHKATIPRCRRLPRRTVSQRAPISLLGTVAFKRYNTVLHRFGRCLVGKWRTYGQNHDRHPMRAGHNPYEPTSLSAIPRAGRGWP